RSLLQYKTFGKYSVDRYLHVDPEDEVVTLVVTRYTHLFFNRTTNQYNYQYFSDVQTETGTSIQAEILCTLLTPVVSSVNWNISTSDLGPLGGSPEEIQDFFYSLVSMQMILTFNNLNIGPLGLAPFKWQIYVGVFSVLHQFHDLTFPR